MAAGALRDTCAVSCSATLSHGVGGKTEGMTGHSLQDAGVRPLTDSERALLDAFLRYDFQGVEELRTQVGQLRASSGCTCGCGTLDLHIDDVLPRSSGDGPVPVEGTVVSADGQPTGGAPPVRRGRSTVGPGGVLPHRRLASHARSGARAVVSGRAVGRVSCPQTMASGSLSGSLRNTTSTALRRAGRSEGRKQEREDETRGCTQGHRRSALFVGLWHQRVGERGEHGSRSEGERQ